MQKNDTRLVFRNVNYLERQPTRYESEPWDWITAELACGIADSFFDVATLIVANRQELPTTLGADHWSRIPGEIPMSRSVYFDAGLKSQFLPRSRDHFEQIVSFYRPYIPFPKDYENLYCEEGALITAFIGNAEINSCKKRADSGPRDFLAIVDAGRIFDFEWSLASWSLKASEKYLDHLLKVADPVVSRINAVLIDC